MLFYLAAAVSDFFMPWADMVRAPGAACVCLFTQLLCCWVFAGKHAALFAPTGLYHSVPSKDACFDSSL